MQEITWAIAAVKESIKTTDDGSDEAREVFDSVSRLLRASEEELDQLARRTEGVGDEDEVLVVRLGAMTCVLNND